MIVWEYIKSFYQYVYYRMHQRKEDSLITIIETKCDSYEEKINE